MSTEPALGAAGSYMRTSVSLPLRLSVCPSVRLSIQLRLGPSVKVKVKGIQAPHARKRRKAEMVSAASDARVSFRKPSASPWHLSLIVVILPRGPRGLIPPTPPPPPDSCFGFRGVVAHVLCTRTSVPKYFRTLSSLGWARRSRTIGELDPNLDVSTPYMSYLRIYRIDARQLIDPLLTCRARDDLDNWSSLVVVVLVSSSPSSVDAVAEKPRQKAKPNKVLGPQLRAMS